MKVYVVLLVALVGCAGTQVVPDRLRADRQMGQVFGRWDSTPEILLHSSVSRETAVAVNRELEELNAVTGCHYRPRIMTPEETDKHLVYGGLPGAVVIMEDAPMLPAAGTAEMHLDKTNSHLHYVEVRLGSKSTPHTVRHELVHALTGVMDNEGGDHNLLMSTEWHNNTDSEERDLAPSYSEGFELLASEKALFQPCW